MSVNKSFGTDDASFLAAGQFDGLLRLCERFYVHMETLDDAKVIRAMHRDDLTESIDKLARFLSGWLGGPKLYSEKYGSIAIPRAHAHLPIGSAERDAWMLCMQHALAEQPYTKEFKAYMLEQLFVPAERCRTLD